MEYNTNEQLSEYQPLSSYCPKADRSERGEIHEWQTHELVPVSVGMRPHVWVNSKTYFFRALIDRSFGACFISWIERFLPFSEWHLSAVLSSSVLTELPGSLICFVVL